MEEMNQTIKQKMELVDEIVEKMERSQSVVFIDYRGLTVEEVTGLRTEFRNAGVEYRVIKNNLLVRASQRLGIEDAVPLLVGPTAVAFGFDDPVSPAKIISNFIDKSRKIEIKFGILGGRVMDQKGVEALASLPDMDTLRAMLLGVLLAPIQGLASVLNAVPTKLVYALKAISEKKEA